MIQVNQNDDTYTLILSPNQSLSWQINKRIWFCMLAVNLTIGLVFTYLGAWMILPFAGLEIILVGIGMYIACIKLGKKEVLTLYANCITLEKGLYAPQQSWRWQTSKTYFEKLPIHYPGDAPNIVLRHQNDRVMIGHFLNQEDKKALYRQLCRLGIPELRS